MTLLFLHQIFWVLGLRAINRNSFRIRVQKEFGWAWESRSKRWWKKLLPFHYYFNYLRGKASSYTYSKTKYRWIQSGIWLETIAFLSGIWIYSAVPAKTSTDIILNIYCPTDILNVYCPTHIILNVYCPTYIILNIYCPTDIILNVYCPTNIILNIYCPPNSNFFLVLIARKIDPITIWGFVKVFRTETCSTDITFTISVNCINILRLLSN
jgi:hypothetical protein